MKLHRQAHVVYKTQYHLVWVTRYRRKILVPGVAEYLKKVLRSVRGFHPDWFLEEIGVDRDHVHLHMVIPPKYAVSRVVETLKSVTSRQLKEKFPHMVRKVYWRWWRSLGTRVFRLHGGDQRGDDSALCPAPRRAGDGSSAA
ncbi:MAG: IS200/IS605 family transposase [Nitrospira sp.]